LKPEVRLKASIISSVVKDVTIHKLLTAKRNAQEIFLSSVLQNEGNSWSEFYRFLNRRKRNRENIPAIKDCNRGLITDPVYKANN
jgi:hypothetical protein